MTEIINIWGGPGAGKSMAAAQAYLDLSKLGYRVELIREYIKDWVWEGRKRFFLDQVYVMGKQMRREQICLGQIDYIVTDSPVWLSAFYDKYYCDHADSITNLVKEYYKELRSLKHGVFDLFIERSGPYVSAGRYESEREAIDVDHALRRFCWDQNIIISPIKRDESIVDKLRDCGFNFDRDVVSL